MRLDSTVQSAPISWNADARSVKAALERLPGVGVVRVSRVLFNNKTTVVFPLGTVRQHQCRPLVCDLCHPWYLRRPSLLPTVLYPSAVPTSVPISIPSGVPTAFPTTLPTLDPTLCPRSCLPLSQQAHLLLRALACHIRQNHVGLGLGRRIPHLGKDIPAMTVLWSEGSSDRMSENGLARRSRLCEKCIALSGHFHASDWLGMERGAVEVMRNGTSKLGGAFG